MSFYVLDENPVRSANAMCWLDCESAAFDGARIIVSAIKMNGEDVEDIPFKPHDGHPLVKWALVSKDNARWLYRNTRAATIKWGKEHKMKGYEELMKMLNKVASVIDTRLPEGQTTLFGNFYVSSEDTHINDFSNPTKTDETPTIESNRVYYERTRKHLMWGDHKPELYGDEEK